MTSRYWRSADGKRTLDMSLVFYTSVCSPSSEDTERLHVYSAGEPADDGIVLEDSEMDSFLAALDAWRQEQEKSDGPRPNQKLADDIEEFERAVDAQLNHGRLELFKLRERVRDLERESDDRGPGPFSKWAH